MAVTNHIAAITLNEEGDSADIWSEFSFGTGGPGGAGIAPVILDKVRLAAEFQKHPGTSSAEVIFVRIPIQGNPNLQELNDDRGAAIDFKGNWWEQKKKP